MPLPAAPRVGWIQAPSPVTELPSLADRAGLGWLGAKRDDLIPALYGGAPPPDGGFTAAAGSPQRRSRR